MRTTITVNNEKFLCSPIKNGEGKYAKCYLLSSGEILKVYKTNLFEDQAYYAHNLLPLIGIKNDTFIFPSSLIYDENEKVLGCISEYIPGKTLQAKKRTITFEDLISSVDKVYEDIKKISDLGIFTDDLSPNNIIFNKRIFIIDTDDYFVAGKNFNNESTTYISNIRSFNKTILDYISKDEKMLDINVPWFISRNCNLKELRQELLDTRTASLSLADFLIEFKIQIGKYKGEEVKKINDIHKTLARVRR